MIIDRIINGDCLEVMKEIPDGSIDMVLCDLPYGTTRNKWDVVIPFEPLWAQYKRIVKPNGVIILNCDGLFTAKLIESNEKMWRYNLIWDKQRGCDFLNANVKPLKSHEDIAVFYANKPTYNKQPWFSKPYKRTKNGRLSDNYGDRKSAWSESADGARNPLSILSFSRDGKRLHPTQKPVALLEYLIKTYTNEGETILDNCAGSMSTAIAAINTNRHYIMIEKDEHYFEVGKSRIEEHKRSRAIEIPVGTDLNTLEVAREYYFQDATIKHYDNQEEWSDKDNCRGLSMRSTQNYQR